MRGNAEDLIAQIREGVMKRQPVPGKVDQYGSRFTGVVPVPKGSGVVRTGWIFDRGLTPRLTTTFPR
jgi:filamentous hemagglutinin